MKLFILILGAPTLYARPQVNSEIFSDQDLLAIDSDLVAQTSVVAAPPGFFSGGGSGAVGFAAQPQRQQPSAPSGGTGLVSYRNAHNRDGSYEFGYETEDGQSREESGQVTADGYSVSGSWSYMGTDGIQRTVVFTADKDGFKPTILKGDAPRQGRKQQTVRVARKSSNFASRREGNRRNQIRPAAARLPGLDRSRRLRQRKQLRRRYR